jgi:hypothetical protein
MMVTQSNQATADFKLGTRGRNKPVPYSQLETGRKIFSEVLHLRSEIAVGLALQEGQERASIHAFRKGFGVRDLP